MAASVATPVQAEGGTGKASVSGRAPAELADWVVELGVAELSALLRDGKVTSVQLVKAYQARIDAYEGAYADEPGINAVIRTDPNAVAEAARLDAERRRGIIRGPLHGIPILVKDNYDTGDLPTSSGSLALEAWRPADDAEQVRRLRAAGAIVIAKTNLHEFASGITSISSLGGQTRNPYDQTRNPGGSSGGTGAGVAASFAAAGMGSDTCGSIRIPAAHNSLVGLRPTLGLSSRDGIAPMSYTQDTGGPLTKTVMDTALILDGTVGYDPKDPSTETSVGKTPQTYTASLTSDALVGKRIALLTDYLGTSPAEHATTALIERAVDDMGTQGAEVVEIPGQPELMAAVSQAGVINDEFERDLNKYLAAPGSRFPKSLAALEAPEDVVTMDDIITSGEVTPTVLQSLKTRQGRSAGPQDEYHSHLAQRAKAQELLRDLLEDYDLDAVVYPTVRRPATPIGEAQPGSTCALSANTGFPALTVPAGFSPEGMPIGVELLGLPFTEQTLLGIGYDYEQATHHSLPPASTPPLAR